MASGLSSSSVGTYAGQIVMADFMNWRIPLLARRALTMAPSVIVLALTDGSQLAAVLAGGTSPAALLVMSCSASVLYPVRRAHT
jgi:Mn2+/Fe2+ NRAMP family transporter